MTKKILIKDDFFLTMIEKSNIAYMQSNYGLWANPFREDSTLDVYLMQLEKGVSRRHAKELLSKFLTDEVVSKILQHTDTGSSYHIQFTELAGKWLLQITRLW